MIPQPLQGSKYERCISAGRLLGELAARDINGRAIVDHDRFALGPKAYFEKAAAIAAKGFLDPIAQALFVESFCRTAHAVLSGEREGDL